MKKVFYTFILLSFALTYLLIPFTAATHAYAWIGRMDNEASSIIGQPDFDSVAANQGLAVSAKTLNRPRGVWEGNGRLAICDWMNNRILIFNTIPTTNNPSADVVIGQPDMATNDSNHGGSVMAYTLNQPGGIYGGGNEFVVPDTGNNRVLLFHGLPTQNNASADVVLGQSDFLSNSYDPDNVTSSNMSGPEDAWTDGHKIIIADRDNNRIMIWNSIPTTNGQAADVIVGQPDFTSHADNQDLGHPDAYTLSRPNGVSSDGTKLFIADSGNARILIYNHIPISNNQAADAEFGQTDFTKSDANQGLSQPDINTIGGNDSPQRVYTEGTRLYICDKDNQRILELNSIPTQNNASADAVFGQPNFVTKGVAAGTKGLSSPRSIFAGSSQFYVTDRSNNRVMVFKLAPENPSIVIDLGATSTSDQSVTLSLSATGAKEMQISNNSSFSNASWEPYATTKSWNLASTVSYKGGRYAEAADTTTKTVYVKFRDWGNYETNPISTTIIFVSTPSAISSLPITGSRASVNDILWLLAISLGVSVLVSPISRKIRSKRSQN